MRYIGFGCPPPCDQCEGTGKIRRSAVRFHCHSCNGTGIKGSPILGLALCVLAVLLWVGFLFYVLRDK